MVYPGYFVFRVVARVLDICDRTRWATRNGGGYLFRHLYVFYGSEAFCWVVNVCAVGIVGHAGVIKGDRVFTRGWAGGGKASSVERFK